MAIDPRTRLRGSFVDVLQRQAGELAHLAREALGDPDVRDALRFELQQIRGTAASLGVASVERAAATALAACDRGNASEAVANLIDVCLALEGLEPVLRAVVVLGVSLENVGPHAAVLRQVETVEEALAAGRAELPGAFVVAYDRLAGFMGAVEGRLRAVPVYAVGAGEHLDQRIEAARLGAVSYLSEPLDTRTVLDRVRARVGEPDPPPYRVLVVEPDRRHGAEVADAIKRDDRVVRWVRDPMKTLLQAEEFSPELFLIASDCGSLDGIDLAAVFRGHPHFADAPILFMADQDDLERTGLFATVNDVVVKPACGPLLDARVAGRLARVRRARRERDRDPLTGVLNRGMFLRSADREVGLAERKGTPLSVVLIDIDGMRAINRERGLPAGDKVLRALGEVLQGSVRDTDVVGRVSGDAFGVLMPDCVAEDARRRIDACREPFAGALADGRAGEVTFSAGVADTGAGLHDVLLRADRALVQARLRGSRKTEVSR